jgi:hypothetical protein
MTTNWSRLFASMPITPKFHCPLCDTSPATEKLWIAHLECDLHCSRREQFLSEKSEERELISLRIKADTANMNQLNYIIKKVTELKNPDGRRE